jgi:hypothetical protein
LINHFRCFIVARNDFFRMSFFWVRGSLSLNRKDVISLFVIAFGTNGLKDIVDHLAREFESVDMAFEIKLVVEDSDMQLKMSSVARERSIARFDINVTTRKYLELFERLAKSTLE